MSDIEPAIARQRHTPWDAVMASALGLILLAAGWKDVSAYLVHRKHLVPNFAFFDPIGGEPVGNDEMYRWEESWVLLSNMGKVEKNGSARFRHVLGPQSAILISTPLSHAQLNFHYYNGIADQDMTVFCDGRVVEQFTHLPMGPIVRQYPLALHPGINDVTLVFARYNHSGVELGPDRRPIAGTFTNLDLTLN